MYTIDNCVKDLDKLKIFDKNKKINPISLLKSIKEYEKIFYQTNACYTKSNSTNIIPFLKDKIEHIRLVSTDKAEIDMWDINPDRCKKYIIFCEGISCEKSNILQQHAYKRLIESGWGVIAFDYRGRAKSSGTFSQKGALSDIESIYQYLRSKNITPSDIGIIGHSMGCGVAGDFCSSTQTAFIILINPFSKAADMAKRIAAKATLPKFVKFLMQKMPSWLIPLKNKFDNEKALKKIKSPVLIIHTAKDPIIPSELARKLYLKNSRKNVSYKEFNGNDHEINNEKIEYCLKFIEQFI